MLKKYNGFLVEKLTTGLSLILEGEIHAGGGFMSKLKEIQKGHGRESEIADKLIDVIESEDHFEDDNIKQNYFDSTEKEDMVSFILNNKIPKSWDSDEDASLPYNIKGRNEIKIGKVIRTIFDLIEKENGDTGIGDISDKDIEKFVNAYKASKVTKIKFKLVKGDEIAEYYNEGKYYSQAGTLGGSCMKDEGEDYFELYTKNTRKVRLLIYVDDNDVIYGRAIVWKLSKSPCEAQYFMDRVYVNRDSDEIKFKKFAEEKGWLYKRYMNAYIDKNVVFMYKGKEVCGEIKVKLDGDCDEYPFVDTLCFYGRDAELSNLPSDDCNFLHSVCGECERCDDCGGSMTLLGDDIDELVSSEDYEPDITLCSSCCEGHIELLNRGIRTYYNGLKK